MTGKRSWVVATLAVALMIYAEHAFEQHQSYKTGVYIGKAAFQTEDYKNRQCLSVPSVQRGCDVNDLSKDSALEDALASVNIIPSLSGSTALHTGFRDGWLEARRTAAVANR